MCSWCFNWIFLWHAFWNNILELVINVVQRRIIVWCIQFLEWSDDGFVYIFMMILFNYIWLFFKINGLDSLLYVFFPPKILFSTNVLFIFKYSFFNSVLIGYIFLQSWLLVVYSSWSIYLVTLSVSFLDNYRSYNLFSRVVPAPDGIIISILTC